MSLCRTQLNLQQKAMTVEVPVSVSRIGIAPRGWLCRTHLSILALVGPPLRTVYCQPLGGPNNCRKVRAERQLQPVGSWMGESPPCLRLPTQAQDGPHARGFHSPSFWKASPPMWAQAAASGLRHWGRPPLFLLLLRYLPHVVHMVGGGDRIISFSVCILIGCICPFCGGLYYLRHLTCPPSI